MGARFGERTNEPGMWRRCLILSLLLTTLARAEVSDADFRQFVFFAVLEGLYEQSLPDATVDRLLARDVMTGQPFHFVYACPICHPTFDALTLYRGRQPFYGNKEGKRDFASRLDPAVFERLNADDPQVRADALALLMEGFIARKIAASRWTPDESRAWQQKFELAKEEGEKHLRDYQDRNLSTYRWMKSCSVCRGAVEGAK